MSEHSDDRHSEAPLPRIVALVFILGAVLAVHFSVRACAADEAPQSKTPAVDSKAAEHFHTKIRPLLAARCVECHGPEKQKGGLRLDSQAAAVKGGDSGVVLVPGKPGESLLIQVLRYTGDIKMPPKSKLPDAEIALLVRWVQEGAAWPAENASPPQHPGRVGPTTITAADRSFWAFQPVSAPRAPDIKDGEWPESSVDRFILAELEAHGLTPAPPADKRTLIRRATFDLIGLPPTPAEVDAFLADEAPNAFATVIDRLLASPRYGERWGRHWLDVARYADSNGLDENLAYANAFRYRDYVVAAFNNDKPFDRFLHEQIAGDLLSDSAGLDETIERTIATGFLTLGGKMLAEDDPVKMQMDIVDEQVDTIGRAVLGLTLGCARCHDHKYDPLPQTDYYALAGIFKSTKTMENFSVVARWQERPLASAEAVRQRDAHQKQIDMSKSEIAAVVQRANEEILAEARQQAGKYLLATLAQQLREARNAANESLVSAGDTAGKAELREKFVEQWAAYLKKTGSDPESPFAVWNVQVAVTYPNLSKRESGEAAPPNDKEARPNPIPESTASRALRGMLLADPKPTTLTELAARYERLFAEADRTWRTLQATGAGLEAKALPDPAQEALRVVLYDPKGPYSVPKNVEEFYSEAAANDLKTRREALKALEALLPRLPEAMAVSDGKPEDLRVHLRGSHLTLGAEAPRGFPRILAGDDRAPLDEHQSGRLQFARWLTAENPLTGRVIANRLWLWHFGEGLVRSPDNFGRLGERPTHPQLLDHLTHELVRQGWSLKALHRVIMLSATYQMSTAYNEMAAAADPENRLWWRRNRRRLEAEAIRDALLAVAGTIDLTMQGTLLPTPNRQYVTSTANVNPVIYESTRRSIYLPVVRSALYDVFQAFDFADPSTLNGKRDSTTVAPQALFMLNSSFVLKHTRTLAMRLLAEYGLDDAARIGQLYEVGLSRPPTDREMALGLAFVVRYAAAGTAQQLPAEESRLRAWQALCRTVLASNEFVYIE